MLYAPTAESIHDYRSIMRSRTFRPPRNDRSFVFAELSRNIEGACAKARSHRLMAGHASAYLKTQSFDYYGFEFALPRPTAAPEDLLAVIRKRFDEIWRPGIRYRATGIRLDSLVPFDRTTTDLFTRPADQRESTLLYGAIDRLTRRYGDEIIFLGSSLPAVVSDAAKKGRFGRRLSAVELRENVRSKLGIPYLGEVR
jgi:hypothetical protein